MELLRFIKNESSGPALPANASNSRLAKWWLKGPPLVRCLEPADKAMLGFLAGSSSQLLVRDLWSVPMLAGCLWSALIVGCLLPSLRGFLSAAALAIIVANLQFSHQKAVQLPASIESQSIQIIGHIVGLPQQDPSRTRFDFLIDNTGALKVGTAERVAALANVKVRLNCYRCRFELLPDQRWQLTVRLKRPNGFASWAAFDYEKFLFRHQVSATGYLREQESNLLLGPGSRSVHAWRWELRQQLAGVFAQFEIGAGMIAALMLGDKSALSHAHQQVFQTTGVSHLMAISGLHVGLVFIATVWLLNRLLWPLARIYATVPRQYIVLLPALSAAFAYSALAGFAVSTERAFTMLCVYVVCRLTARSMNLIRVLMLAAVTILLVDPFSILDAGFWLSCSAVLVIAVVSQQERKISLFKLQPALWLGMMPLSVLLFGQISVISPLVNLIAVPLFCLIMIPLVLVGLTLQQLGLTVIANELLLYLALIFEFIYQALEWLASAPIALIYPPAIANWQWGMLTLLLFATLVQWRWLLLVVPLSCWWLWPSQQRLAADEYWLTLLDVGQGLSMVVEAHNQVLVYDTGPAYGTGFSAAQAVLLPYLRQRGIRRIDHLIVSHADNDHIGGLPVLLGAISVDQILTSRLDKIPTASACRAGQHWQYGSVSFAILSPNAATPAGSNNHSCVLRVGNGHLTALITGDIEKQVERYLLAQQTPALSADFMLVPHQGSKTSSTEEFIDAVDPHLALVAAGYKNHYRHPHDKVLRRYKERDIAVLSTISSGSIQLKIKGKSWSGVSYRDAEKRFWFK